MAFIVDYDLPALNSALPLPGCAVPRGGLTSRSCLGGYTISGGRHRTIFMPDLAADRYCDPRRW